MSWASNASERNRRAARKACEAVGRLVRDDVRQSISTRVFRYGGVVFRSEPGEPPFRENGDLWRSVKYRVLDEANSVEAVEVYTDDMPKAFYLEKGTEDMEARPFMAPARKRAGDLTPLWKRLYRQYLKG